MSIPDHFKDCNEIIIIKLSSLGDVIHTLPAYSALRKFFHQKKITWVVEKKAKQILDLVPSLDRIIAVDIKNKPLLSRKFWSSINELKSSIKNQRSLSIDFQGLIKSGLICYLSHAQHRIGFHKKNLKEPMASYFYTDHSNLVSEQIHVIQKNMRLLSALKIKENKWEFPIHISDKLIHSTLDKMKNNGIHINQNAVIFNIGGAWETKRWFSDYWIQLIRVLDLTDFSPLILWGTPEEKNIAKKISKKTGVKITPFLSIKEVLALIKQSILVVSGDSFPLQAACALSTPVVGLFGPTNPGRNGPFNKRDKIAFHKINCSYCYKHKCSKLDCMKKIKPDEVARLCNETLCQPI
ncbi:MAG: glycosyltransferase family 9 protein [Acidobacteriota bacterium]